MATDTRTDTRREPGTDDPGATPFEQVAGVMSQAAGAAGELAARTGETVQQQLPGAVARGRAAAGETMRAVGDAPTGTLVAVTTLSLGAAIGATLSGGSRVIAAGSLMLATLMAGTLIARRGFASEPPGV